MFFSKGTHTPPSPRERDILKCLQVSRRLYALIRRSWLRLLVLFVRGGAVSLSRPSLARRILAWESALVLKGWVNLITVLFLYESIWNREQLFLHVNKNFGTIVRCSFVFSDTVNDNIDEKSIFVAVKYYYDVKTKRRF